MHGPGHRVAFDPAAALANPRPCAARRLFLRDGADSKQLHTAKASADGLLAAYMTADGLTGARDIFDGAQGLGTGLSDDADISRLADGLGSRWALAETSFKYQYLDISNSDKNYFYLINYTFSLKIGLQLDIVF